MITLIVDWNPSPELVKFGGIAIRYYSLMFVIAFTLGSYIMKKIFIEDQISLDKIDPLFIYVVFGTLLGARLGHVFFYDWAYYQHHLIEILLPIRENPQATLFGFIKGWQFIGFAGLASHGATIGIILSLYFYSKKIMQKPMLYIIDRITIPVAIGGAFVRLGNLMNSEIIGKPTNSDYGFIFRRLGEDFPRHPAQLYEAISYVVIFVIMWFLYWKTDKKEKIGYLFGIFFVMLWSARFVIEFFKEAQVNERMSWTLNTGQLLSIPMIMAGFYFMFRKVR
ncbi:MAG: prolipoprotein diacylglyceryl transferase [Flavobacteriaceae bacterium]|nr:prolipoprotein diacylglyceryl transferase [Flavobacteriaceae bacterium]